MKHDAVAAQKAAESAGKSALKSMQSNPATYRVGKDAEGANQCPAGNIEDPKFSNKRGIPGS